MKNLILLILFIAASCNSVSTDKSNIVSDFLNDVSTLKNTEEGNPILLFKEYANEEADKVIEIGDDNIEDVLEEAKEYKYCVVTVADHTIIKITDIKDCKKSTSWSANMPMAEGYIKRGAFEYQEDYMNNIIGLPDSQTRTAYLFD